MPSFYTDHYVNQTVTQFFSKSLELPLFNINDYKDNDEIFITYGILRDLSSNKKEREFIYIDHGFYRSSQENYQRKENNFK